MNEQLPDGVRLMSGSEAIVIMQRLFREARCPVVIKQNMTMAGVLQLAEHWLDNVEERRRVLGEASVPTVITGAK